VQQARALGRRRSAPVTIQCGAGRFNGAINVGLDGHSHLCQWLAGRRLDELLHVTAGSLGRLPVDEEQVLALGRNRHGRDPS
jgi:hypothetical protein